MLVVADDLSGAVEVAAVLGAKRIALGHADGDVVDLDTRALPPEQAARRVRELDGRITFKKIDSLLRGNVVAELEALCGEMIVAPALPIEGRTVRGGVLHVYGVPQRPRPSTCSTPRPTRTSTRSSPPPRRTRRSSDQPASRPRSAAGSAPPTPEPDAARRPAARRRRHPRRGRAAAAPRRRPCRWSAGRPSRSRAKIAAAPKSDLVLTGGETARRTLDALGVTTLEAIAKIHDGAVQCRTPDGRHVTIRPGGFGGPDSLLQIVEATCRLR